MVPGFDPSPSKQSEETLNSAPTPLPFQDVCELEPLSDAETEHAVQALQRQGSSFDVHISSPTRGSLSSVPVSQSPGVQFPTPNPATPPADTQPFTTNAVCHLPNSHPLSPVMPVLDVEPQPHTPCPSPGPPCPSPGPSCPSPDTPCPSPDTPCPSPDTPCPSPDTPCPSPDTPCPSPDTPCPSPDTPCPSPDTPCPSPDRPCPSPDPYSLPPVLSPQVFNSSYIMEPHCLYTDPPVLSPQWYTAEEALEGHTCEMDTAESASRSVPAVTIFAPTPLPPSVALTNAEGTSCPPPQRSMTSPNPKKRCRSASLKHSHSKKRRITGKFSYSVSWTEEGHTSATPESDTEAKPEGVLLFEKVSCSPILQSFPNPTVSSTCTGETRGSKQTFTLFCVPTAQNFTLAPNPMDVLGRGSTSIGDCPSWPRSSKAKTFDPPLQFPADKSNSVFSSQDSQHSLSHSTSVCIESALIPDLATSSSESDWDCNLLGPTSAAPPLPTEQGCELDKELLHRPCTWAHNSSYESRLHTVLQTSTPAASLCGEEMDPSSFSRTVVQIVEVQH
ncbi:uncharacterized protein [Pempheris klunzingeri]|uniref:uncharacterized protein n=1 Tax=Pempheris klunzingeri TaxID=3127111 RepID=UPI0039814824